MLINACSSQASMLNFISVLLQLYRALVLCNGYSAGSYTKWADPRSLLWICNLNLEFSKCETDVCWHNCLEQTCARYHETSSRAVSSRARPPLVHDPCIPGDDTPLIKSLRQSWYRDHRHNPSHNLVWNFLISFIFVFADWDFAS